MNHILCLMHPMDPRGVKLGGIETHVRHLIAHHPEDMRLVFVGVDERGDCAIGKPISIEAFGRRLVFLPVAHEPADGINRPATHLFRSITLRTVFGALRHWRTIRRLTRGAPASAQLQRFEFAPVARALGLPAVQVVHGEGSKKDKMDSLIKRFWFMHAGAEKLALRLARRIMCVNPAIVARIEQEFPIEASKTAMMTVSVDRDLFKPQPFDVADDVFRIMFAGRLDQFKDPPLMFRIFARLHERLNGKFEFHYVGTSDPARYEEFAAIRDFTVRHGYQQSDGVARIAARCHAGVLTSYFEGMPCYLLEMLSAGRPFAAIRLPQYDPLIVDGISGRLVERDETIEISETVMAEAFLDVWSGIRKGEYEPQRISDLTEPYSIRRQLAQLFEWQRTIARPPAPPTANGASPEAAWS
ncbi:glycosyltransferase [Terrarubrum flagellatum]|uniref:glycosyltransferase family 4 protein n=1 Tax=Terrirubrum flagellatum TaxID=2895980 RepID=UPI003145597D